MLNCGLPQTEHLNTPRLVVDANQTTVWRWEQAEPFGVTTPNEDPDGNSVAFEMPLRFPGQYADKETGLFYNVRRDYASDIGRYVESDPIGLRGGINTYAYVGGDPLLGVDPFGLAKFCCRPVADGYALGSKHCWIVADDGTKYGLYPETVEGRNVGIPRTNDERDRGGDCADCPRRQCGPDQNTCIRDAHNGYPRGSYLAWPGPNSNTYAGTLARACCEGGVPPGMGWTPGVDMAPPKW